MDCNKDEALKCVNVGKHALSSGDGARALRFLSKARRLDPSLPLDDLLSAARGTLLEMAEESFSNQLIDGDGHFKEHRIEAFKKALNLADCGRSYAVVSIMGPQSSGKSTLLNHLFHTNFREMDASKGKSQTTKGIGLAKAVDIDPCTIVLDLEGSDGSERGQDDTIFEKQSALFALAVSDIMLINIWDQDIGRENAANKPLLKTVLQVTTRLVKPRKMTLLFVIRDISKTPLEKLEQKLREDMQKIWDSVYKQGAYRVTLLGELYKIEVVALSHYEYRKDQFMEEVATLRKRFNHSIAPDGLAGDQRKEVPVGDFFFSAQKIWQRIKENKDLDVPALSIMVATTRCQQIAKEKTAGFSSDEEWCQLKRAVQHGLMPHFGQTLGRLLEKFLSGYDLEAQYFDDHVKTEERTKLESELLKLAYPAYKSMMSHLRSKTLDDFKEAFDKALQGGKELDNAVRDCVPPLLFKFDADCEEAVVGLSKWDSLEVCEKVTELGENVMRDIGAHVASVRAHKLSLKYEEAIRWNKDQDEKIRNLQEANRRNNNKQATGRRNPKILVGAASVAASLIVCIVTGGAVSSLG